MSLTKGLTIIDSAKYLEIIDYTVQRIEENFSLLNTMNLFPVADGDTGTNILLTLKNGTKSITHIKNSELKYISAQFYESLMVNSRGNSGVILAQYFKGFHNGVGGSQNLTLEGLFNSLDSAYHSAYNAVSNPQEGTILSVMKVSVDFSELKSYESGNEALKALYEKSCKALIHCKNQLEILKEAGIIDSGAFAFTFFIEAIYFTLSTDTLKNKKQCISEWQKEIQAYTPEYSYQFKVWKEKLKTNLDPLTSNEDLKYRYCTEFLLDLESTKGNLQKELLAFGDSLVLIDNGSKYKVHIHCNEVEKLLDYSETLGTVHRVKVDDMKYQHHNSFDLDNNKEIFSPSANQDISILSIAFSKGYSDIMESLGADKAIVAKDSEKLNILDLLTALSSLRSSEVFILPNDYSIKDLIDKACEISFQNTHIIHSKTIPEGISAIIAFNETDNLAQNKENMTGAINNVKSVYVTHGYNENNRDAKSYFALHNNSLLLSGDCPKTVLNNSINRLIEKSHSLITLYYGESQTQDSINDIMLSLSTNYKSLDFEFLSSDHPDYHYVLAIE